MHFLSALILAVILYPTFEWKVLLIFIGGFLIDIDHYLWYAYKYKKLDLHDCYTHYAVDSYKNNFKDVRGDLLIFHTIEFLLMMVILSFYTELALMFTVGLLLHYLLDLGWYYFIPKQFIANHSIMYWIVKNKFQKI